jgi:hypothetical protein
MKLILPVLIFLPAMALAQTGYSPEKKVTILLTNISLEEALTVLGISYAVEFSYSDDIVPTQETVNLTVDNEKLVDVLDTLLSPYHLSYKIVKNRVMLRKASAIFTQTIRGKVVDQLTDAPVPFASIIVSGTSPLLGSTTDESGNFRIPAVPVGRLTVAVSCIGYDVKNLTHILLGTGKELVTEIRLTPSVTAMKEIVITGLKNDGIPGNGTAVTSSHSFSVEDTKRYAGSLGDPARMATAFAGVTGASDESNALIVRGNSPRGVLWRVEGIEIPNPNHFTTEGASSGVVSVLSPNMVERSDFLTGAFPAQYGNALSAVFDIALRNGNNERREHSFSAGTLGIEASAEGPFARHHPASYLVNYRYSTLSILDKIGVDLNEAGQYKNYQDLAFKLHYPTARAGTFSVFGIGGTSRSNKTNQALIDNNSSDIGVLGGTYKNLVNESTLLTGAISLSGTRITKYHEIGGLQDGPLRVEENYSKSFLRSSVTVRKKLTDRYFMEGGLIHSRLLYDFYLRDRDPGNTAYQDIVNFSEHGTTSITQGFLYSRQYFSPSLFGFYGLHVLYFDLTQDHSWEPRAGLRWQLSAEKSLSIAYGKHSRLENLQYYLARDHQTGGDEVQINKDLGSTRAGHFVIAYEQTLIPKHLLKIETYYQRLTNVPVRADPSSLYATLNEDTGFITDTLVNNGRGKNYGVEVSLERSFTQNFYYLVNASVFQSTFDRKGESSRSTAYNGNYSLHFLAGKEIDLRSNRIGFNLKVTQAGGRRYVPIDLPGSIQQGSTIYDWQAAFEHKLPDYFRADLQIVYRTNRPAYAVEWRLDIQNFTNHRNAAYYYYDPARESIRLKKQTGIIPLLTCMIEF